MEPLNSSGQSRQSSTSAKSPEERYIHAINTEVFGEVNVRETLWAVQSLANAPNTEYITKSEVADEVGIDVQKLHNTSALDVLERFGIVELVPKVNRTNESYVLIDKQICGWLDAAPEYGPSRPPDEDKFPHSRKKVEHYGEYFGVSDDVKSEIDNERTPTEVNFELIAQELGVRPPISASISIQSSKMIRGGSTIQWRFEMEGCVEGDLGNAVKETIKNRIQSEIFKRAICSLLKHRVKCACKTVREHLINVVNGTADLVEEDICYVEILDNQDAIHFEIIITKIVSDGNA